MNRPLLISDCDEVLLHMLVPFAQWLDEAHDVHFNIDTLFNEETGGYLNAMRCKLSGDKVEQERIWPFLKGFFETEMHRQMPIHHQLLIWLHCYFAPGRNSLRHI